MINLFGFSIFLIHIHVTTLALLLCAVAFADHEAFAWLRGKKETLSKKILMRVHLFTWAGLLVMVTTGVQMALPLADFLVTNVAFYFKMFFVSALIINAVVIGFLLNVAAERSFASLSRKERIPLFISGGVSTVSWIGAIVSAFAMGIGL
ncbi:MAG: hypothetical protein AAB439_02185 [Patescibacteria group bacterium]